MSRKTILAVTAVVTLGAAALAPTSASAFGHFGGGGGAHFSGGSHPMSLNRTTSHTQSFQSFNRTSHTQSFSRPISHGPSIKGSHFVKGPHMDHDHDHGHYHDHDHDHHQHDVWWWKHHHHPYWVYPVGGTTVETTDDAATPSYSATPSYAAAPAAKVTTKDNCNCLTKSYLEDGSVMFKDLCTKEAAVATPDELKAQAEGAPSTQQQ